MFPKELPSGPWTHLALVVCGPFPTGEHVVVLSKGPENHLPTLAQRTILTWLSNVFAHHATSLHTTATWKYCNPTTHPTSAQQN